MFFDIMNNPKTKKIRRVSNCTKSNLKNAQSIKLYRTESKKKYKNLDNFHIETANRLDRLRCYYGDGAQAIVFALQLAEEHLRHELSERALDALLSPTPAVSGVYFGECREAEGENLAAIGRSWMSANTRSLKSLQRWLLAFDLPRALKIVGQLFT